MITHDELYDCLVKAFPAAPERPGTPAVTLLARYDDPALELPNGVAHVFLPDCHMLTPADAQAFSKYVFHLDGDLEILLKALAGVYRDRSDEMIFYQLGDLLDLWRTLGGGGDTLEARAIAAHYTRVMSLLRSQAPEGLNATILAGNHDFALREIGDWLAPRFLGIGGRRHKGGKALILHGDAFDWIEGLPDAMQEFFVRLIRSRASGRKDLGSVEADIARDVNRRLSRDPAADPFADGAEIAEGDDLAPRFTKPDADKKAVKFYASALSLAEESTGQNEDLRVVVIGHTHSPRIVAGKRADGKPFALMDCGAWVGSFKVPGRPEEIMKAQLGVIVGNDLRVYQVGHRPAPA